MYFRTLQIRLVAWYSVNGTNSYFSSYFGIETLTRRPYEVGLNPSWETNGHSPFPVPLWNPNAYHRTLKQEAVTGYYPQPNESSQRPFTLFTIHFNNIFPTMPRHSNVGQTLQTINRDYWNYVRRQFFQFSIEKWKSIIQENIFYKCSLSYVAYFTVHSL
jgi:hypothetical protein